MQHVMNFTDVDDRTIAGAQKAGLPLREYTDQYIAAFREDAAALGLEPVEENPRATDQANLRAMAEMIDALERQRPHLPQRRVDLLQDRDAAGLRQAGAARSRGHAGRARASTRTSYAKDDARDFVLWKATQARRADLGLSASGPGRPGWHIECSAMALRLLGEPPIDIHAGGIDLVFPHHENEIAQSEGATGKPFSRFWVHVEHLIVDDEKMSKSLGNVYTLPDVVERGLPRRRRCATCCCRRTTASSSTSRGRAWSRPKRRCAG